MSELTNAEKLEKAHAMVSALCKRRGDPDAREWLMSIPARPNYDPDLVIGEGLRVGDRLLTENESLTNQLATATERIVELEATLDGDPHQTATPEQRQMWRRSAVRYADKVEAQLATAKKALEYIKLHAGPDFIDEPHLEAVATKALEDISV